jgi:hypothetical protein
MAEERRVMAEQRRVMAEQRRVMAEQRRVRHTCCRQLFVFVMRVVDMSMIRTDSQ